MNNSSELRIYKDNTKEFYLYKEMYENQSIELIKEKRNKYNKTNYKMSIKKALCLLDDFIDPSDPDVDVPNSIHAYQTAERIRKIYPYNKELQIVGLIHDLGKVLFTFGEKNWCVVGDTYVLGCEFPKSIIYYDCLKKNMDFNKYDKYGIYEKGCGLDKLYISYGHDEYLYQVLKKNKEKHCISEKYMNVIRYHSFYPWHSKNEYRDFMKKDDYKILNDVIHFNKFDLYSKEDDKILITKEIKNYYNSLLDEFFNSELLW